MLGRAAAPPVRAVLTMAPQEPSGSSTPTYTPTRSSSSSSSSPPTDAADGAPSAAGGAGSATWDDGVLARMAAEVDAGVAAQSLAVLAEVTARRLQAALRDAARTTHAAGTSDLVEAGKGPVYDPVTARLCHDALDRLETAAGFTLLAAAAVGAMRSAVAASATATASSRAAAPVAAAPSLSLPPRTRPPAAVDPLVAAVLGVVPEDGNDDDDEGGDTAAPSARATASATVASPPPPHGSSGGRSKPARGGGRPGRLLVASPARRDVALAAARAALAAGPALDIAARTLGSQRMWNDAGNGLAAEPSGAAVLTMLHALGTRLWVNYPTLAKRARAHGALLPTARELFVSGVRSRPGAPSGDSAPAPDTATAAAGSIVAGGAPGRAPAGDTAGHAHPDGGLPRRAGLAASMMGALARDGKGLAPGIATIARSRSVQLTPGSGHDPLPSVAGADAGAEARIRSRRTSAGMEGGDAGGAPPGSSLRAMGGTLRAVATLRRVQSTNGGPGGPTPAGGGGGGGGGSTSGHRGSLRTPSAFSSFAMPPGGISMSAFLAAAATATTGTVTYVSSVEPVPGSVAAECLFVVMPVARWDTILRRQWRLCCRAAVFRRRLVYLLMLDRVDTEAKVQQRMVDMLAKLRGPRAAADATLALIRSMGPLNRRAFFERLGEEMKSQVVHESAAEAAAAAALVEVARSLCGCAVLRESLAPLVLERVAGRRDAPAAAGAGSGARGGTLARGRSYIGRDDAITALLDIADETHAAAASAAAAAGGAVKSPARLVAAPSFRSPAPPPSARSPPTATRPLGAAFAPAEGAAASVGGGAGGAFTPRRPVAVPAVTVSSSASSASITSQPAASPSTASSPATSPPAAAPAHGRPAGAEGDAASLSNVRIAREMILMHTELQGARGELEQERARRIAAEAEVARLRELVRQLQAAARGGAALPAGASPR